MKNIKYNNLGFIFSIFLILNFINPSNAAWITKKSDTSQELLKVDDMYSKGYLNKNECTKMKAKLLKISDATGMCDDVETIINSEDVTPKSYDWMAEVRHPKTNNIFTATRVSSEDKAIKLAIQKCYAFVSSNLNKQGYNDCYVSKTLNTNDDKSETFKIVKNEDKGEVGTWTAIVEHKVKNLLYESNVKSSKQLAINDAMSKCWFDWRHKEGDWPSENCILISTNNKEIKSTFITKKSKDDQKKEKDLSNKIVTKKEKVIRHYETIRDLPNGQQFYFVA